MKHTFHNSPDSDGLDDNAPPLDRAQRAEKVLKGLSDVQRSAAMHKDGPMVVFAGAGSGKTRIITTRIAYLIESGVRPWEILAVTFTNKAAGEMRHRLESMTPHSGRCLIATFHAACARWLREFAGDLGFNSDFTIYDDDDSLAAVKTVLKELAIATDGKFTAAEYKSAISTIKTAALFPNQGEKIQAQFNGVVPPDIVQVYRKYQEYLSFCNAMDFADLLMNVLLLLRNNENVRGVMQQRYKYILVDEYQDTNRTQFEIISLLAEKHRNLCVVGDDDQSIYSWRGATPSNIIDFNEIYPEAKSVTLDQNYRCSGVVVNAASSMIAHNRKRVEKKLWTANPIGEKITYRIESDGELEAWWVAQTIIDELGSFSLSDVAVFYRTNSQSRAIEEALRRENLSYTIYGTVRFYDRAEIKDLMGYLRVLVNPADDISLKRVINTPTRGIGAVAIESLEREAMNAGVPMIKALEDAAAVGGRGKAKLTVFWDLLTDLKGSILKAPLESVVEILLEATNYTEHLRKKYPDLAEEKIENVHELAAGLAEFQKRNPESGLAEWLQSVTLSSSEKGDGTGVSLMTLHMAKGLEFNRVYIVGLEDGLLPHRSSMDDPWDIEEERRLFYVGMTRTKQKLSLLSAWQRRVYANTMANAPSRFLKEIPSEYLQVIGDPGGMQQRPRFVEPKTSRFEETDDGPKYDFSDHDSGEVMSVKVGAFVSHPTYGKGRVEKITNEFGMIKVVVNFGETGCRLVAAHHLS